ncbi:MAG: glucosaminidase domain-containing protein [Wenzhouxiangellaceae bacterium]|nr:glucosaminidase domain-containing protein [Wenzhouxiangellaceae bacterium]
MSGQDVIRAVLQTLDRFNPVRLALGVGTVLAAAVALIVVLVSGSGAERLPDFAAIDDIPARKQAFFSYLAPYVQAENARVLERRARLEGIAERLDSGRLAGWRDRRWLDRLAAEYEIQWDPEAPREGIEQLLRRVDSVPVALALVQAAAESGWGRSRFAVEGNNLFGHWCYEPGCGLVPEQRAAGAGHEVAAFGSVRDSVARYIHNLNTHPAYEPLRRIRARLRRAGRTPGAMALADGLVMYSERREDYVEEVKNVIETNRPIIHEVLQ